MSQWSLHRKEQSLGDKIRAKGNAEWVILIIKIAFITPRTGGNSKIKANNGENRINYRF